MGLGEFFGWNRVDLPIDQLPEIFPIGISQLDFVRIDVISIYSRILTDVVERTHGLTDDQMDVLWDNCIKSESSEGLITHLAKAMTDTTDLFLVYDVALKLLRLANSIEQQQITDDYKKSGESNVGVYVSFGHFRRSLLVKIYSALEYFTVASLNKAINLSKAVQVKANELRAGTSLNDSVNVKEQALAIATALSKGQDVLMDVKDEILTQIPDLTGIQTAIEFINEKRCFYLGMPDCYISGEQTSGLNAKGEGDSKAIERGLKNYYYSIMKPVFDALFDVDTSYKSQDFTQIAGAVEVLKVFAVTDDELVSKENKTLIMNRLLDLPEDAVGDEPKDPPPVLVKDGQKFATPPKA